MAKPKGKTTSRGRPPKKMGRPRDPNARRARVYVALYPYELQEWAREAELAGYARLNDWVIAVLDERLVPPLRERKLPEHLGSRSEELVVFAHPHEREGWAVRAKAAGHKTPAWIRWRINTAIELSL